MVFCTMTGIDESVNLERLAAITTHFPFVEWGVLYSESRAGAGRYPRLEWIRDLLGGYMALHVCGRAVQEFIAGGPVYHVGQRFRRVQLNFRYQEHNLLALERLIVNFPRPIITQHNKSNEGLLNVIGINSNHHILFDKSGGRGILPPQWPRPISRMFCGYAGGLGPDNLKEELPKISAVTRGNRFWIDMEGKLRDENDRFDLDKAMRVLEIVATIRRGEIPARHK